MADLVGDHIGLRELPGEWKRRARSSKKARSR
jgi:hypothetical protein